MELVAYLRREPFSLYTFLSAFPSMLYPSYRASDFEPDFLRLGSALAGIYKVCTLAS
jgi:hypothetical protein